jgi:hypothetical protein
MANYVTSSIYIKGTKELIDEVDKIFDHKKGGDKYSEKSEWLARTVYEDFDPSRAWMSENVGTKWCHLEQDSREGDDTFWFTTVSAWGFPKEYLEKLTETLLEIDDSVVIECTYQDEAPNFVGGFYGSKNGTKFHEGDDYEYPDEDDYLDDEGDVDYDAYDEAMDSFYYELDEVAQEYLSEAKYDVEGDLITE